MTFPFLSSPEPGNARRADADAGVIVFLMMALVFVPIIAAHAAMIWQDQLAGIAPQQLAALVNMILPAF